MIGGGDGQHNNVRLCKLLCKPAGAVGDGVHASTLRAAAHALVLNSGFKWRLEQRVNASARVGVSTTTVSSIHLSPQQENQLADVLVQHRELACGGSVDRRAAHTTRVDTYPIPLCQRKVLAHRLVHLAARVEQ